MHVNGNHYKILVNIIYTISCGNEVIFNEV